MQNVIQGLSETKREIMERVKMPFYRFKRTTGKVYEDFTTELEVDTTKASIFIHDKLHKGAQKISDYSKNTKKQKMADYMVITKDQREKKIQKLIDKIVEEQQYIMNSMNKDHSYDLGSVAMGNMSNTLNELKEKINDRQKVKNEQLAMELFQEIKEKSKLLGMDEG